MKALIIAEHDGNILSHTAAYLVTASTKLAGQVDAVIIGTSTGDAAKALAAISGINTVYTISQPGKYPLAEAVAGQIHAHLSDYDYYLAAATSIGKDCLPRLAALLDVAQLSDVIEIVTPNTFKRPIYAGNAIETVQSGDKQKIITIRPSSFEAAGTGGSAIIKAVEAGALQPLTTLIDYRKTASKRPDLTAARIVISGGRGVGSAENFKRLEALADKLGAAVGASRAAVDAGYVPNDYQVGQTGKIVAPDLYLALGISGAIQHLAGIKDSRIIVAVNKDENAPIFEIADYGLVADLFTVLSELEARL